MARYQSFIQYIKDTSEEDEILENATNFLDIEIDYKINDILTHYKRFKRSTNVNKKI